MTLIGHQVTVELKNDLAITGILSSVDQFLNIKLDNIRVIDDAKYPHMMAVKNCFIRGSVVRLEKELAKAEKELERNIEKF
nr:4278_t:CDS:2 [Entrophospora candida]